MSILSRYTKLQLWNEEDDFDLILFLDSDTLAIGRVEAILEWFAPNNIAVSPLGAAHDVRGDRSTFNAGVLSVQTNRTLFKEMMKAAENKEVSWDGLYAEQASLIHVSHAASPKLQLSHVPQAHGWICRAEFTASCRLFDCCLQHHDDSFISTI
jgi:lipopolysaccharide biosynthesis glycosyltransferase